MAQTHFFSVTVLTVCDMLLFKKLSSIQRCFFYLDGVLVALSEVVADRVHHAVKELYHEQGRDLKIYSRLPPAYIYGQCIYMKQP